MIPGLRVLAPGLHTTVQDFGRIGYRNVGIPVSGALDRRNHALANALVGNPPGAAALEILYGSPRFAVRAKSVRLALAGADAHLLTAAGRAFRPWQSLTLERGEEFSVVPGRRASLSYLAIAGGVAVPHFLGSASTYVRGGFGGIAGRALKPGDAIPVAFDQAPQAPESRLPSPPSSADDRPVRIVLGPQQDLFTDAAIATLLASPFGVSANADRMGMRLDGPRLAQKEGWDIVSDAIPTGAIQVPGSGQPILLLADHQTTGGYPKIATVISADLSRIGRLQPGDKLRFEAVTVEAAEDLAREAMRELAALIASLEPVFPSDRLDVASLYGSNLISGVVSGSE